VLFLFVYHNVSFRSLVLSFVGMPLKIPRRNLFVVVQRFRQDAISAQFRQQSHTGGDMWAVSTVFSGRMISCVSVTTGFYRHCKTERITVPRCTNSSMKIECISSSLLEEERELCLVDSTT
jgi:hypothetical protein